MRVGIFGGSFNPVHNMHINIGLYLINNNYLDKVIFVPQGINYQYKDNLESNIDRYNMLLLATKKYKNLYVSDYELNDEISYTYKTLDYFKKIYKEDTIYFICGLDNLDYIDKWMNGEYILNNYNILVINRDNYNLEDILNKYKIYKSNITICNIDKYNISSTLIRNKINNNEDVNDLIDEKVLNYIKVKKLYKNI